MVEFVTKNLNFRRMLENLHPCNSAAVFGVIWYLLGEMSETELQLKTLV